MTANVARTTECQISVDFSSPVGPSASIVKTLFLAMLEDAGAMIEEFPAARISTVENSVRLSCQLSNDSLQRLVSLIVPPRAPHQLPESAPATTPPEAEPQPTPQPAVDQATLELRANRRYLSSVNRMIDDLFRSSQNATDSRRVLTWHETFARRIETLPTVNVSPELIEFGQRTARHFRTLATSLRGEAIKVDTKNRAITHEVTHVDPGWAYANYWGGFGYRPASVQVSSNLQQIREQQAATVIAGGLERAKIWDMIRADQAEANNRIRRN